VTLKKSKLNIRRKAEAANCMALLVDAFTNDPTERQDIMILALMQILGSGAMLTIGTQDLKKGGHTCYRYSHQ
jgi:hypothetical protein